MYVRACVCVCMCGSLSVCVTASACSCTCILVCLHDSWTTYNAIHRTYMSVPLSFSFPFYGLKTRIVHIAAGGELATSRCCWILIVCVLSSNAAFCHFPLPLTCPCTFCLCACVCMSLSLSVCISSFLRPHLCALGFLSTVPKEEWAVTVESFYIAPLLADFRSPNSTSQTIAYKDFGNMFVVQWRGVVLDTQQTEEPFSFQCTLNRDGSIEFDYLEASSRNRPVLLKEERECACVCVSVCLCVCAYV